MTTRSRHLKMAMVLGAGLLAFILVGALTGRRCIVIEDAPDGELAVAPISIEFSPNGGSTVTPISAHRGACVLVRTNVTIAGRPYSAGDKLVVDAEGHIAHASWVQALRMSFGYWTARKAGGPHLKQASRSLN